MPTPAIGSRVLVPVGSRSLVGCVVDHVSPPPADSSESEAPGIKDVCEILDPEPLLLRSTIELCRWVAEYYMCGIGDAIAPALPPGSRGAGSRRGRGPDAFRTRRIATLTAHGASVAAGVDDTGGHRVPTPKQRAAIEALGAVPLGLTFAELRDRGVAADTVTRLARSGLVAIRTEEDFRDPFGSAALPDVPPDAGRVLTLDQDEALRRLTALADARQFRVALLRGVTGSGKTEVYVRLAGHVRASGRQVLMLVPEIALTPAAAAVVRGTFGDRVAIQHSALSSGERHDQWHRIRRGEVDLVIGTRSAVFAPLPRLGLIVVDEEHDTSYKQEETPRYHGRDVAVMRGSREGALVVLGSATPSMETYHNARSGKYEESVLSRRVLDRALAAVRIVNMREEYADEGPDVVVSRTLGDAVADRLSRREQVVVMLNRRGYATAVFCRQCGDTLDCPNCSVSLTVHRGRAPRAGAASPSAAAPGGIGRCHYCNHSMRVPSRCRKCAAPYLEQAGFGTEKVEERLRERFPEARIGRVDRDAVRRKGSLTSLLTRFAAGELDVLVGTQMIAKGHDFPNVTLVGVISADVGLGMADFRAAERTFQLLTQVAGRAGRGARPGEAIVQTLFPEHYSIRLGCQQDYPAFFEKEQQFRRSMLYPPHVAMVNVIVRGRTFSEAHVTASDLARRVTAASSDPGVVLLGPAPAPLARLRGEHRVQFFLKGRRRGAMRLALQSVLSAMPDVRRRVTVDVDPLNLL
jgi:primosomal protein N' (replication factor Y)